MRVRFSREAGVDLVGIYQSIAAERPAAADRIVGHIRRKTELLEQHAYLGAVEQRYGRDLRSTTADNYVIYYRVKSPWIEIVRILHGSRDHASLLGDDVHDVPEA